MDIMQPYEVNFILDSIEYADKTSWEQTRLQMYIMAQVNSTKKLKPSDIMQFKWDNNVVDKDTSISEEDKNRLSERAKYIQQKYMSNNKK